MERDNFYRLSSSLKGKEGVVVQNERNEFGDFIENFRNVLTQDYNQQQDLVNIYLPTNVERQGNYNPLTHRIQRFIEPHEERPFHLNHTPSGLELNNGELLPIQDATIIERINHELQHGDRFLILHDLVINQNPHRFVERYFSFINENESIIEGLKTFMRTYEISHFVFGRIGSLLLYFLAGCPLSESENYAHILATNLSRLGDNIRLFYNGDLPRNEIQIVRFPTRLIPLLEMIRGIDDPNSNETGPSNASNSNIAGPSNNNRIMITDINMFPSVNGLNIVLADLQVARENNSIRTVISEDQPQSGAGEAEGGEPIPREERIQQLIQENNTFLTRMRQNLDNSIEALREHIANPPQGFFNLRQIINYALLGGGITGILLISAPTILTIIRGGRSFLTTRGNALPGPVIVAGLMRAAHFIINNNANTIDLIRDFIYYY